MKAAAYEQFGGDISIRELPDPRPHADGVVMRVEASGVCRSDWIGWMGHDPDIATFPHVPGHEFAGTIEEVGAAVSRWKPGDLVTVPFCVGCGTCPPCRDDLGNICDNHFQPGFTAWGSFAELVAIRYADLNVVLLPDSIDSITAASLGCRFATSWRAVTTLGRVAPGEWVTVIGCGGVGLAAVMIAAAHGARVIAVDIDRAKLELARNLGAEEIIESGDGRVVVSAVREITSGGAHLSIDALGSPQTCKTSILGLRKRGRHVQVGLIVDANTPAVPMHVVIARELEILGSHGMQASRYGEMFSLIETGRIDPRRLVGSVVGLDDAPAALAGMGSFQGTGVTVIDMTRG
jgi:alcohol dehydrogenase